MSALEDTLAQQMEWAGLPVPEREYAFAKPRRWRFDFAWTWVEQGPTIGNSPRRTIRWLAVEVDGGTRSQGRHVRGSGYEADCVKLNEAALLGWTVLRVTGEMVEDGRALRLVQRALGREVA